MNPTPSIDPASIPPHIALKAVEWMVEIKDSSDAGLHQQLADWLDQHPDHRRAWQRIAEVNAGLGGMSSSLSSTMGKALAQAAIAAPQSLGRRRAVKLLSTLLFASGAAWTVSKTERWTDTWADAYTGVGEYKTLQLADGTQLMLNTNSAVDIRYSSERRDIALLRGEVMIATAKDARPMQLVTRHGSMQPLGTRFNVRLDQHFTRLAVLEGKVAVSALTLPQPEVILLAGEQIMFNAQELGHRHVLNERSLSWVDGMLVVSQMRLQDFVQELSRHRSGVLRCDPALAELKVSGSFPLADTDLILKNLSSIFPLKLQYITRYWVNLLPA